MLPSISPAPLQPRGLTREQAAAYCGLSPQGLDRWVKRGLVPGPIPGTRRWDRHALDQALDRLNSSAPTENNGNAFDQWKQRRDRK